MTKVNAWFFDGEALHEIYGTDLNGEPIAKLVARWDEDAQKLRAWNETPEVSPPTPPMPRNDVLSSLLLDKSWFTMRKDGVVEYRHQQLPSMRIEFTVKDVEILVKWLAENKAEKTNA